MNKGAVPWWFTQRDIAFFSAYRMRRWHAGLTKGDAAIPPDWDEVATVHHIRVTTCSSIVGPD